jgi:hypothetical protein
MPGNRAITGSINASRGFVGTAAFVVSADGRDDDGIFFLQKTFDNLEAASWAFVTWQFAPYDPAEDIGQWPRIAYLGPPRALALPDRQHDFVWFSIRDGLLSSRSELPWNRQCHLQIFQKPLQKVQVCVGWKINWETERELALDNIGVVLG